MYMFITLKSLKQLRLFLRGTVNKFENQLWTEHDSCDNNNSWKLIGGVRWWFVAQKFLKENDDGKGYFVGKTVPFNVLRIAF